MPQFLFFFTVISYKEEKSHSKNSKCNRGVCIPKFTKKNLRNKFKGMLVYKTRCSLNLNVPSTLTTLPNSPRKKSEIMRGLAKSVGLQLERCLQKELDSETKWKYEIVKVFFGKRYCLHCPWVEDYVTVYEGGKKQRPCSWGKHSVSSRQDILKLVLALQHFAS